MKGRDHYENLGVDRKIILGGILKYITIDLTEIGCEYVD
jgi:hypothetical protein